MRWRIDLEFNCVLCSHASPEMHQFYNHLYKIAHRIFTEIFFYGVTCFLYNDMQTIIHLAFVWTFLRTCHHPSSLCQLLLIYDFVITQITCRSSAFETLVIHWQHFTHGNKIIGAVMITSECYQCVVAHAISQWRSCSKSLHRKSCSTVTTFSCELRAIYLKGGRSLNAQNMAWKESFLILLKWKRSNICIF